MNRDGWEVHDNMTANEIAQANSNIDNHRTNRGLKTNSEATKYPNGIEKGDYNADMLNHLLTFWNMPKIDSYEEALSRAEWYFSECIKNRMKPTLEGCALSLGIDRVTFKNWSDRAVDGNRDCYVVCKQSREFIQSFDAQAVIDGKMPAIPYIFRVKNNYADYSDRNETTIKLDDPLGKKTAPENLLATITEDVIDVEFSESDLSDG